MSSQPPACTFRYLEGRIKEFVLTEVSRRAVDELFDLTEQIQREAASRNDLVTQSLPVLIDSSVGVQSLNYSMTRLRTVMSEFPETHKSPIAIILPIGPLLRTISVMMRPIAPMRLYIPQGRDEALAWLRARAEAQSGQR